MNELILKKKQNAEEARGKIILLKQEINNIKNKSKNSFYKFDNELLVNEKMIELLLVQEEVALNELHDLLILEKALIYK